MTEREQKEREAFAAAASAWGKNRAYLIAEKGEHCEWMEHEAWAAATAAIIACLESLRTNA